MDDPLSRENPEIVYSFVIKQDNPNKYTIIYH